MQVLCVPTYNHLGQQINIALKVVEYPNISCTSNVAFDEAVEARKVRDVIKSCTAYYHVEVAERMVQQYFKKYGATRFWTNLYHMVNERAEELDLDNINTDERKDGRYDSQRFFHAHRPIQ